MKTETSAIGRYPWGAVVVTLVTWLLPAMWAVFSYALPPQLKSVPHILANRAGVFIGASVFYLPIGLLLGFALSFVFRPRWLLGPRREEPVADFRSMTPRINGVSLHDINRTEGRS